MAKKLTMDWDPRWYERPAEVPVRLSAGGVVARYEAPDVVVALTREIAHAQELPGYVLPKGGVQDEEPLLAAARREIMEEAGLGNLTVLAHLGTGEHLNVDWTRWVHSHYFLFTTDQVDGRPTDAAHHFDVRWFALDDLPQLAWRDQHELLTRHRDRIARLIKAQRTPER